MDGEDAAQTWVYPMLIGLSITPCIVFYLLHWRRRRTVNCLLPAQTSDLVGILTPLLSPGDVLAAKRDGVSSIPPPPTPLPPEFEERARAGRDGLLTNRAVLSGLGACLILIGVANGIVVSAAAGSSSSQALGAASLPWWIVAMATFIPLALGALLLSHAAVTIPSTPIVLSGCYLLVFVMAGAYILSCYSDDASCLGSAGNDVSKTQFALYMVALALATVIPCALIFAGILSSVGYTSTGSTILSIFLLQPPQPSRRQSRSRDPELAQRRRNRRPRNRSKPSSRRSSRRSKRGRNISTDDTPPSDDESASCRYLSSQDSPSPLSSPTASSSSYLDSSS